MSMLDEAENLATDTAVPGGNSAWEGGSMLSLVQSVTKMSWLERYEVLSAENAVLSDRFSKGTLDPQQFAQLQGNIDQMAFLFAVYREAGFPDPNLPIEGGSQKQ